MARKSPELHPHSSEYLMFLHRRPHLRAAFTVLAEQPGFGNGLLMDSIVTQRVPEYLPFFFTWLPGRSYRRRLSLLFRTFVWSRGAEQGTLPSRHATQHTSSWSGSAESCARQAAKGGMRGSSASTMVSMVTPDLSLSVRCR
ncbi:hypothetical protein MRX96_052512 [Rhipicephalus microplus]